MAGTLHQALDMGSDRLRAASIEQPRREAALLISGLLDLPLAAVYAGSDREITPEQARRIEDGAVARAKHVPLAYVTGSVDFSGLRFHVGPGVLIPRPDSECLVEAGLEAAAAILGAPHEAGTPGKAVTFKILDLCAGSGCVGISLAVCLRQRGIPSELWLSEIDPAAAGYAQSNLEAHRLANARLVLADLYPPDQMRYHLIVANPPYIPSADIDGLMPEVSGHEPRLALDGGPDGLGVLRRIASQAADRLLPGGFLLLEHGYDQAELLSAILAAESRFARLPPRRDYGGQLRVSGARRKPVQSPLGP
jgi:release factor glutamine methyltransferase